MTEQSEYVTLGGDVSVTEFGESAMCNHFIFLSF